MKALMSLMSIINLGIRTDKTYLNFTLKPKYLSKFLDILVANNFLTYEIVEYDTHTEIPKHEKPGIKEPKTLFKRARVKHSRLRIFFKKNSFKELKIISTPGRKLSVSVYDLKSLSFKNTNSIFILSTSKLGFTDSVNALKNNTGGILLCKITF